MTCIETTSSGYAVRQEFFLDLNHEEAAYPETIQIATYKPWNVYVSNQINLQYFFEILKEVRFAMGRQIFTFKIKMTKDLNIFPNIHRVVRDQLYFFSITVEDGYFTQELCCFDFDGLVQAMGVMETAQAAIQAVGLRSQHRDDRFVDCFCYLLNHCNFPSSALIGKVQSIKL